MTPGQFLATLDHGYQEDGHRPELEIIQDDGKRLHYFNFVAKLLKKQSIDEMKFHVALGIVGEGGEFADAVKKELIYNKGLDEKNITEELGDAFFYVVAAMLVYNLQWNDIIEANYKKLKTRYEKLIYTDEAAQNRADKNG